MAIDIQQPNYSGLIAIAGKSAPLNIQPTGALGLQALQQGQANQAAIRADALAKAQLQQQGQLGLLSNQTQRRALDLQAQQQQRQGLLEQSQQNLAQQQFQQQGSQNAAENAYKQQLLAQQGALGQAGIDVDKQRLAQDSLAKEVAKLAQEKKETLEEKGALAAYGLVAMKGAKTPEEAQQIRTEIINETLAKKHISPEMAKALGAMPLTGFTNFLTHQAMVFDGISKYKEAMDANKEKTSQLKSITHTNEDGSTTVEEYVDPTAAAKTKSQNTLNDRSQALLKLREMKNSFDPKYFTDIEQFKQGVSAQAERKSGVPLVGAGLDRAAEYLTGKNKEDRATDLNRFTGYMNAVEQFFNQTYKQPMTGAAVGKEELANLRAKYLSGDMSPSEAKGALDQLIKKYVGEKEFEQNFLGKGANVSSSVRDRMIADGHSPEEVDAFLAKKLGQ